MTTFTLSIVGYLNAFPKQAGLNEQGKEVLLQHRELTPSRVQ